MEHLKLRVTPVADPKSVVRFGNARFTILKDRLIRCEYSWDRKFEDAPTQHFWFRQQPVVTCTVEITGKVIEIRTKKLTLNYLETDEGFTAKNLTITLRETGKTWHFGDIDDKNLLGTARTLDNCHGDFDVLRMHRIHLSQGLLSRNGWSVIDDSHSLIFGKDGYLKAWRARETDIYFFGYDGDFKSCIIDYYTISGNARMIPKWALGLWWSRWEKYKQEDLERIASEFENNGVPLSVCVVDMDWHLHGWTGYTWNPKFFPDPKGFFKRMHAKGVHVCMNLHPAGGVGPHEKMYPVMAKALGLDPGSKAPIPFDISDRDFILAYFKYLHHPLEKDGVDFWWVDWQQGERSNLSGLDPLWYLNHLHSNDLARTGEKRPINFSRWGSYGSHRYPIGFSGDTLSTWASLKFQMYFTATAANIGYGWWSHDIGGFAQHFNQEELYVRWVQLGCFSPIFRFHSSGDPRVDNRPWTKSEVFRDIAIEALKLRRELLPYLYTAAWKNRSGGLPLVRPMYHEHSGEENAYKCPNQYYFGDALIAAPFDAAVGKTGMAEKSVWLPKGKWYNFFNGREYKGGKWYKLHGTIKDIPVFAASGSVIPLQKDGGAVDIVLYNGKGTSEIYDDDGVTLDYKKGKFALISCTNEWKGNKVFFSIKKTKGSMVKKVKFNLVLRGIEGNTIKSIIVDGKRTSRTVYVAGKEFRVDSLVYSGRGLFRAVLCFEKGIKASHRAKNFRI